MFNNNFFITVLIPLFTFIGGLIGYYIKYFLDKKKELNSENIKVKREMYKKFVSLVINLFKESKSNSTSKKIVDIRDELYEFYKDYTLYSSPQVINAFSEFMQYTYKNPKSLDTKITLSKLGEVIKTMRSEVGLSNKNLGNHGEKIFRAMFSDFDNL